MQQLSLSYTGTAISITCQVLTELRLSMGVLSKIAGSGNGLSDTKRFGRAKCMTY